MTTLLTLLATAAAIALAVLYERLLTLRTRFEQSERERVRAETALDTMNVHLISFAGKYAVRGAEIETLKRESFARLRIPSNEELEAGQW